MRSYCRIRSYWLGAGAARLCSPAAMGHGWAAPGLPRLLLLLLCCGRPLLVPSEGTTSQGTTSQGTTSQVTVNQETTSQATTSSETTIRHSTTHPSTTSSPKKTQSPSGIGWGAGRGGPGSGRRARGGLSVSLCSVPQTWCPTRPRPASLWRNMTGDPRWCGMSMPRPTGTTTPTSARTTASCW